MKYFQEGFKAFSLSQANNYPDHLRHNWEFFLLYHQIYFIYLEMLMYFMLGFMLSRSGIYQRVKNDRKLRRKWLLISFIGMAIRTPKEEANLIEKFGDEYREYMKRTGRFLPKFRSNWSAKQPGLSPIAPR